MVTSAGRTILIADDVAMFRELGALFLARSARVVTASNGREALDVVRDVRPDLVLADLHMPELDGDALCRILKEDPDLRETPVIVLVGDTDKRGRGRAIRAGADDILSKPLDRVSLIEAVSRMLHSPSRRGLPRVPFAAPITITRDGQESDGTLRNLSRGGIFVEARYPLRHHAEVDVRFVLPRSQTEVRPSAEVRWTRPIAMHQVQHHVRRPALYGIGLRFVEIDGPTVRSLDDYVYEHTPPSSSYGNAPSGA